MFLFLPVKYGCIGYIIVHDMYVCSFIDIARDRGFKVLEHDLFPLLTLNFWILEKLIPVSSGITKIGNTAMKNYKNI